MTDDELIAQLCVRIGMIMEDVCDEAVMARAGSRDALGAVVAKLDKASERISALVQTARVLADFD